MLGAIAGDIIGSVYERHNITVTDFPLFDPQSRFTDDTVLTAAVADVLLTEPDYAGKLREYFRLYPGRGHGPGFKRWAASDRSTPYFSRGNGSAMRVSPVGFAFETLEEVLQEAKRSAEVTHNTEEAIHGAQAIASAIFLARKGEDKQGIKTYVEKAFGYRLSLSLHDLRVYYGLDATCNGSAPHAIKTFLESESFEDAIRKAVAIGGDSDTIACMAGGIAQAFYRGVPQGIADEVKARLDERLNGVVSEFMMRYGALGK